MIRAGAGQSSSSSTEQAVTEAAGAAMAQAGVPRADAVVVFFTVEHARHSHTLFSALTRITGTDRIVGSSAAGILTGAGEVEGQYGIAVLVFSSDEIQSRPFLFQPLRERDGEVGAKIAQTLAPGGLSSLLILFPDTYHGRPDQLLQALEQQAGFCPVVGAGSSENGIAQATYQLCGEACASNSVAGARDVSRSPSRW
jgi:hypothetical protein